MNEFVRFLAAAGVLLTLAACGSKPGKPAAKSSAKPAGASPVAEMLKAQKLEGKVVLVEFGTIGCQLSDQCLDSMAELQRRGAVPGLAFVRLEPTEDQKTVDEYYAKKSLPFPVVPDKGMAIANALGTTVYPRFALLDKFGHVRYRGNMPAVKELADWTRKLGDETADPGPNAAMLGVAKFDVPALLKSSRLPDLGGMVRPLADYRGPKGMLFTFVDTKCPFSARASSDVPAVAAGLARQGITTVLVNIGEPAAEVKKTYRQGVAGAALVYDSTKATQQDWNVQFVPLTVLTDTAGLVMYRGSPVWSAVAAATEKGLGLARGSVKLDAVGTNQG